MQVQAGTNDCNVIGFPDWQSAMRIRDIGSGKVRWSHKEWILLPFGKVTLECRISSYIIQFISLIDESIGVSIVQFICPLARDFIYLLIFHFPV